MTNVERITDGYKKLIYTFPEYKKELLQCWDRMTEGEDWAIVRHWFKTEVFNYDGAYNAISFYGRKIARENGFITAIELEHQMDAERAEKAKRIALYDKNNPVTVGEWKGPYYKG